MVYKGKRRLNIQEAVKWCTKAKEDSIFRKQSNGVQRQKKAQYLGSSQIVYKGKRRLNIQEAVKWCTREKEGSIFRKQLNGVQRKRRHIILKEVKWCTKEKVSLFWKESYAV